MATAGAQSVIESAISTIAEKNPHSTDGRWLELLTVQAGPYIKEWDIETAYSWGDWPDRETHFPDTTNQDVGIDVVATRRSDGEHIAIQCKARRLDEQSRGADIAKGETDKFASASSGAFWAERWLVTNGDNRLTGNASGALSMQDEPLKVINIHRDLLEERGGPSLPEDCPHCQALSSPTPPHKCSNTNQDLYAERGGGRERPHPQRA